LLILYRFKIKTLSSKIPLSSLAVDTMQPISPLFNANHGLRLGVTVPSGTKCW